jgi:hypothetical protein
LHLSCQQQNSITVTATINVTSIDPLLAEKFFRDFLFTYQHKKKTIHDKLKHFGGYISHEFTMMFRVKDSVTLVSWKEGPGKRWTRTIQKRFGISPRLVRRYTRRPSDAVSEIVALSNVLVRDEVQKRVTSSVGPSLVTYNHGRQLLVTNPEDQLLLQQTGMMSGQEMSGQEMSGQEMSGQEMMFFNRLLVEMMVNSIHSTSTTLATLQDKKCQIIPFP